MSSLLISTYNVLHPAYAERYQQRQGCGPKNQWEDDRGERIFKNLKATQTDIICLQEISRKNLDFLANQLKDSGYDFVHTSHLKEDGVAILYKTSRFTLKNFKCSDSRAKWGRSHCFADLEDQQTKKTVRVASLHLRDAKYQSEIANSQVAAVMGMVEEKAHYPIHAVVLGGDFNDTDLKGSVFGKILEKGYQWDLDPSGTEADTGRAIDKIFAKVITAKDSSGSADQASFIESVKVSLPFQNASDHLLRVSRIQLPKNAQSVLPVIKKRLLNVVPYQHRQPNGSFRAKVFEKFSKEFSTMDHDPKLKQEICKLLDDALLEADSQVQNALDRRQVKFPTQLAKLFAGYLDNYRSTYGDSICDDAIAIQKFALSQASIEAVKH